MPHVMALFDSQFLHHYDLPTPEVSVEIEAVTGEELMSQGGQTKKAPVVKFKGAKKALVLNKTNARTLMSMFGPETSRWVGKKVVLYTASTKLGKDNVGCIRVKNTAA